MDRKSWIILAICAVLLGLGFYAQNQKRGIEEANKARQAAVEAQASPTVAPTPIPAPNIPGTSDIAPKPLVPAGAGLVVEKPVAPEVEKESWELISKVRTRKEEKIAARFVFTSIGGALEYVELPDQMVDSKNCRDHNVRLNESAVAGIGSLVFGVNGANAPVFDKGIYVRVDSQSTDSKLVLVGRASNNLIVRKEYSLIPQVDENGKNIHGNAYMLDLKMTIQNGEEFPVRVENMGLFAGLNGPVNADEPGMYTHFFWRADNSFTQETTSYFTGGFFSSAKPLAFESTPNLEYAGVMGQFFVNIVIPQENAQGQHIFAVSKDITMHNSVKIGKAVELAVTIPSMDLQAKESKLLDYDIFTGPKLNQVLGAMPGKLDDVMGYGWLTLLSEPMNWLLNIFHGWFGNWGWAIIGMTIVVRGLIWPLHRKSYMSMKRMSQLQPMMKELREKYPNDPQKMNMETMKLYQTYGINPMSGCLPMLIQIPIFFAFYRVLQSSTEMRGEPFILWIQDLARPDTVADMHLPFSVPFIGADIPINILPIIMAATMILQMRLTPKAGDKMQQRIMNLMPVMFFAFCYNFASALALYWTTQNIISIGQNFLIRRLPEPKLNDKKPKKPGFFQKLMEQQRAMLEQQEKAKPKSGGGNMKNVTPKKK